MPRRNFPVQVFQFFLFLSSDSLRLFPLPPFLLPFTLSPFPLRAQMLYGYGCLDQTSDKRIQAFLQPLSPSIGPGLSGIQGIIVLNPQEQYPVRRIVILLSAIHPGVFFFFFHLGSGQFFLSAVEVFIKGECNDFRSLPMRISSRLTTRTRG